MCVDSIDVIETRISMGSMISIDAHDTRNLVRWDKVVSALVAPTWLRWDNMYTSDQSFEDGTNFQCLFHRFISCLPSFRMGSEDQFEEQLLFSCYKHCLWFLCCSCDAPSLSNEKETEGHLGQHPPNISVQYCKCTHCAKQMFPPVFPPVVPSARYQMLVHQLGWRKSEWCLGKQRLRCGIFVTFLIWSKANEYCEPNSWGWRCHLDEGSRYCYDPADAGWHAWGSQSAYRLFCTDQI